MFEGLAGLGPWAVPLVIFFAEMTVVTVGTLRIIFVSRGRKYLAPLLGFFEVLTWLFAITQVMQNLGELPCFLAFALGFMVGNWLGILIEGRLALGMVVVRVFTPPDAGNLVEQLRAENFGVTCVEGRGAKGPVQIVMTVIKRKLLPRVKQLIESFQPNAFYSVDEVQAAAAGVFPVARRPELNPLPGALRWFQAGKSGERVALPEGKG